MARASEDFPLEDASDGLEGTLDPLGLARHIEDRYLSYLETAFAFRDKELQESFRQELRSGKGVCRGPYLAGQPSYVRTVTVRHLIEELMGPALARPEIATAASALATALDAERQLYRHQERTIRLVDQGRNAVVSTGTGSGKTEAFLIPILLYLLREYANGTLATPGVRALVLYPMNALAYDQRERLGSIYSQLSLSGCGFGFTFGQYVGSTPENAKDQRRGGHLQKRLNGQPVFREIGRAHV